MSGEGGSSDLPTDRPQSRLRYSGVSSPLFRDGKKEDLRR